jgi:hypothetical protein
MRNYAVIIPFFQRPEITELCFKHIARQRDEMQFFDVIACGSEGQKSRELAEKYAITYYDYINAPVSEKNNYLLSKTKGYEGVILLGSDDFLTTEQLKHYQTLDTSKSCVYGFDTVIFYDVSSCSTYKYVQENYTVGAGRMFTKTLLEACDYSLWNKRANRGLDYIASQTVLKHGIEIKIQGEVLDVKHEKNITSHEIINLCAKLSNDYLLKYKINGLNLLQESSTKQIKLDMDGSKVKVVYIEDAAGVEKGTVKNLPSRLASQLMDMGVVQMFVETESVKPKRTRKPKQDADN